VAHPYAEVVVDDVEIGYWQMWTNPVSTHGIIVANGLVPRGPGMGYHVAPWQRLVV
jgi:hypothetical protein